MVNIEAKSIVWDLDGTLIDSFGIAQEIFTSVFPKHGHLAPTTELMTANYHGSLNDTVNNLCGGDLADAEVESIVADFLEEQNSHYGIIEHHFFPDAVDLAARAHAQGLFQVIVTNRFHEGRLNASPRSIVERSVLKDMIDTVVSGDDSEHRKPKPAVVSGLLDSGRINPETTIVVGDQFVDGEFAKNLGARAVLVSRGGGQIPHLEKLGDDWQQHVDIVTSLSEVELS